MENFDQEKNNPSHHEETNKTEQKREKTVMTVEEKKEKIDYLCGPEGESTLLYVYATHLGKAPESVEEVKEHVLKCGHCLYAAFLRKRAKDNKIFINENHNG